MLKSVISEDKALFILANQQVRERCARWVLQEAPEGWAIEGRAPGRNLEQNARFHAICGRVAKSGIEWAGKRRSLAQWKVLFVSGHAKATNENFDLIPGLESEFVNLRESTALMSKKRSASLIEYTQAWCDANGIDISIPAKEQ